MWILYAVLSAIFAAFTSILAKIGLKEVNSNLATAIRTIVILVMAWGIVLLNGSHKGISKIDGKTLIFIVLSGIATGASWLFYFKALQTGEASKVVPIDKLSVVITIVLAYFLLGEAITLKTAMAGILITMGTLLLVL